MVGQENQNGLELGDCLSPKSDKAMVKIDSLGMAGLYYEKVWEIFKTITFSLPLKGFFPIFTINENGEGAFLGDKTYKSGFALRMEPLGIFNFQARSH